GELAFGKGYGLADAVGKREVTTNSIFRIASISKTITAVGLMRLWEAGRFQLDDPVNDRLKAFRIEHPDRGAPPITFRHLLTHTAGIGEVRRRSDLVRMSVLKGTKVGDPVPYVADFLSPTLRPDLH